MYEPPDYLDIDAPDFEVLPRPRLEGRDDRRPDFARTSFQSAVARSFIDRPDAPIEHGVVTIDVPGYDYVPAAATLKAVIDAAVIARVLKNDRSALVAARLRKYELRHRAQPTTSVEVVPHQPSDKYYGSFITTPSQFDKRIVARSVVDSVAYAYRSGVPGEAAYQNEWVSGPADYEDHLRSRWHELVAGGRVLTEPDDWAALLLSAALTVHLPTTCTEDGDNALLYIVDMLEVVRRDMFGDDTGERTLDQMLIEVSFQRSLESGVKIRLSPVDQHDQYNAYYAGEEGWMNPFDPDAL